MTYKLIRVLYRNCDSYSIREIYSDQKCLANNRIWLSFQHLRALSKLDSCAEFSDRWFEDNQITKSEMLRNNPYYCGQRWVTVSCLLYVNLYMYLPFDLLEDYFTAASKRTWNIEHFVLPSLVKFSAHLKQNSNQHCMTGFTVVKKPKKASYQAA